MIPTVLAVIERNNTEQLRAERVRKLLRNKVPRPADLELHSSDAVIIRDRKNRIISWNKGAEEMYGYTETEALGMRISRIIPESRHVRTREWLRQSAQGKKMVPIHTLRRTKDGRTLDVLLTVTVLRYDKGHPAEIATTERDITGLRQVEREFCQLHARVISTQETERKRLARELHDGVSQILLGAKYSLQSLLDGIALSRGAKARSVKVCGLLDHAISELRNVSHNLMPAELEDIGLETALLALGREFKERSGVQMTVRTARADVAPELRLALFRIAQEALNNIAKHSQATSAAINLTREGNELVLSVSDNGIGFAPGDRGQSAAQGIGLRSMNQRAESVGGSIEVDSKLGAGTTLHVHVPLSGLRGPRET